MSDTLLSVQNLHTEFRTGAGVVPAVRGVTFDVQRSETVGVVGESGSGKSVTALSLMRLIPSPPGKVTQGTIDFDGRNLLTLSPREMRQVRGGKISMVFQDPFSALNPTMTLGAQVMESILAHSKMSKSDARNRAIELLRSVRIPSPELRMKSYAHQISGGQRQRVMIAMAFSTDPQLIIADEPTTALDVTVQAQIMALMDDFRTRTKASIVLITHDLGVVAEICQRVLVMYAGQIVEEAPVKSIFAAPKHPYTIGLLESLPDLSAGSAERLKSIPGQPPDLLNLKLGCAFADRCPKVMDVCRAVEPSLIQVETGQSVRCHLYSAPPADVS